jgi:hypothetical protein
MLRLCSDSSRLRAEALWRASTSLSGEICPRWPCGVWRCIRPVRHLVDQAWAQGKAVGLCERTRQQAAMHTARAMEQSLT